MHFLRNQIKQVPFATFRCIVEKAARYKSWIHSYYTRWNTSLPKFPPQDWKPSGAETRVDKKKTPSLVHPNSKAHFRSSKIVPLRSTHSSRNPPPSSTRSIYDDSSNGAPPKCRKQKKRNEFPSQEKQCCISNRGGNSLSRLEKLLEIEGDETKVVSLDIYTEPPGRRGTSATDSRRLSEYSLFLVFLSPTRARIVPNSIPPKEVGFLFSPRFV